MKTVYVTEHHRPNKENDQMLLSIDNVYFVKNAIHDLKWLENRILDYRNDDRSKIIMMKLDITELNDIVNDFVYHGHLEQPCSVSIYAMRTTNINMLWEAIRNILDHNLIKAQPKV